MLVDARPERLGMPKSTSDHLLNDADRGKGSKEPDERSQSGNNSMTDQLGHRNPDPMQDGADSDFPEPGHSPEHSFEAEFTRPNYRRAGRPPPSHHPTG